MEATARGAGCHSLIASLRLDSGAQPDWSAQLPEGVLLLVAKHLGPSNIADARLVCKPWREAFSVLIATARMEIKEHQAAKAREFMRAFTAAFPSARELVLGVSFRRTGREKIQLAIEAYLQALASFSVQHLHIHLDLNSFNERKIKVPDLALLAHWSSLTSLTIQESGWRSQQLRVDPGAVFGAIPTLQHLTVTCKYSSTTKAKWVRPLPWNVPQSQRTGRTAVPSSSDPVPMDVSLPSGRVAACDVPAATASIQQQLQQVALVPIITQHLRCQLTQNQTMQSELQKALRRIKDALLPSITALTFEVVEETYAEPIVASGPLEVSALPGLKSLTLLSGAEDALADSKLELLGATSLESLVIYDISCGRWCYSKPGHGIPSRLLTAPLAALRSLTVVGFILNQCKNLHELSLLMCLEELRLEQPDPESLAGVSGELLLAQLPLSLRVLKLHSMVLQGGALTCAAPGNLPLPALSAHGSRGSGAGTTASSSSWAGSYRPVVPQPGVPVAHGAASTSAGGVPAAGWPAGAAGGVRPHLSVTSLSDPSALYDALCRVADTAPLPHLRELYLSRCKVASFGMFGVCKHLTSLGVINCLSCSGMVPAAAAFPALRQLVLSHTATCTAGQEDGALGMQGGLPSPGAGMPPAAAGAYGAAPAGVDPGLRGGSGAAGGSGGVVPPGLLVPGLPLPPVVWASDEQVAAVAACRGITSLQLIAPRGTCGMHSVMALSTMAAVTELDLALPCVLSECMLGLAALRWLQRLTLWVDSRTCINRARARELQAIQRNLQAHMPCTLVEWAAAESRQGDWTGFEAQVFSAY